jgi:actin-related protein
MLQDKNLSIKTVNERIKLNEELNKHELSTDDIDKLLNLLLNAKEYGFDSKKL